MSAAQRILLVEDDPSIVIGLRMNLEREGYSIELAEDGDAALERIRDCEFDLVLLDVMLPKRNGYEVLDALRKEGNLTPVVMLSARSAEMDKVMGLDLGAEDYIPKPFSVAELLARVRVALRRGRPQPQPQAQLQVSSAASTTSASADGGGGWRMGEIEVDPARHQVRKAGSDVALTAKEFEVLQLLKVSRGRVLSRQVIFDHVWGDSHHGTLRTIDNFISQLRAKLEDDPAEPKYLVTVRGVGYRLDPSGRGE